MAPLPSLHTTACFLVVCVASSTLAEYCRKAKLPLITGYILAGIDGAARFAWGLCPARLGGVWGLAGRL